MSAEGINAAAGRNPGVELCVRYDHQGHAMARAKRGTFEVSEPIPPKAQKSDRMLAQFLERLAKKV